MESNEDPANLRDRRYPWLACRPEHVKESSDER